MPRKPSTPGPRIVVSREMWGCFLRWRQLRWHWRYAAKDDGHAYVVELIAIEENLRLRFQLPPLAPVFALDKGAGSHAERQAYRRYRALQRAAKKVTFGQPFTLSAQTPRRQTRESC
jgi:hypothetical protein